MNFLMPAFDALNKIYAPSFFLRIGLRYINIIDREKIGLANVPWSKLLRPELIGELALAGFEENASEVKRTIRVRLPDDHNCGIFLQHGFAKRKSNSEIVYRIDFDYYRDGKAEVGDVKSTLDKFNGMAGRAFRWCITDILHRQLKPIPMELGATVRA